MITAIDKVYDALNNYADTRSAEVAKLQAALTFIGDIAYDADGYAGDAKKLIELMDEIYRYARSPSLVAKINRS